MLDVPVSAAGQPSRRPSPRRRGRHEGSGLAPSCETGVLDRTRSLCVTACWAALEPPAAAAPALDRRFLAHLDAAGVAPEALLAAVAPAWGAAWSTSRDGPWMLAVGGPWSTEPRRVVTGLLPLIEPALARVPSTESRPRRALALLRAWAEADTATPGIQAALDACASAARDLADDPFASKAAESLQLLAPLVGGRRSPAAGHAAHAALVALGRNTPEGRAHAAEAVRSHLPRPALDAAHT